MLRTITICSVLFLCGCQTCPTVKDYPKSQQIEIAKERNALPDNSALLAPLQEWEGFRRACR